MNKGRVLVAVKEKATSAMIVSALEGEYDYDIAQNRRECLEKFLARRYEFTFIDTSFLPPVSAKSDFERGVAEFKEIFPTSEIVAVCPNSPERVADAVAAVNAGVSDYLTLPIIESELHLLINNIVEARIVRGELAHLRDEFWKDESIALVRTNNQRMKEVLKKIRSVAPTKSTVLLTGETGVGKGIIAALIHKHSSRSDQRFVSVHCGAIPDTLIESELFGHEKGAFTGAVRRKLGKFEIAGGGTIFLDEIGTITPMVQIKLLQVLQDKVFSRIGSEINLETDIRVIAATNMDLKLLCKEGKFRTDLYYRLNVFPLEIPPLRDRREDIPLLAEVLLEKFNTTRPNQIRGVDLEVMAAFAGYSWPGNIRELENLMERAFILEESNILKRSSFPDELFTIDKLTTFPELAESAPLAQVRELAVARTEKEYLNRQLRANKGRIDKTAQTAGITTRQLHKLMKKYGLNKKDFKH